MDQIETAASPTSMHDFVLRPELPLNSVVCGDNCEVMRSMPSGLVDLVVTSPPYDDLRVYGGHGWDFYGVAWNLKRLLKDGGVIVWNVNDATKDGSETGSSMRQALHFQSIGLRLHDTMIYRKVNPMPLTHNRYEQEWEYVFVLSKGKPSRWNPLMKANVTAGTSVNWSTRAVQPIEDVNALRAKRPENVREVVDQSELIKLFSELRGVEQLAAMMMYGCSGLRIGDVVKIRIKDISFERKQIHIHSGKGDKSRYVAFPECLHDDVRRQIESMRVVFQDDMRMGLNGVSLPDGFGRKCKSAHKEFSWWYLFASDGYSKCPRSGTLYRHHRDKSHIGRLIKDAVKRAGIDKRITSHCIRHSAAHEMGVDIRTLQVLLGHADIRTTEIYVHANKDKATASKNPLEALLASPVASVIPFNRERKQA